MLLAGLSAVVFLFAGCAAVRSSNPSGGTTPLSIVISPLSASIQIGGTQQFTATISNSTNTMVTWQVNGVTSGNSTTGTISQTGMYTAPSAMPSTASVTITAVAQADQSKTATATITLTATPVISVSVAPTTASVKIGQTQQFTATVANDSNSMGVTWQVNAIAGGNSTVGTISASGLYSAPASMPSPQTVTVKAISVADSTRSATATVTITVTAAQPVVTLTANPATISSGGSSTLNWSSTNATSCAASGGWSGTQATSGTTSVSPTATTTYTLTCTGAGGSGAANAMVTVTGAGSVPGAPMHLTAYATTEGAYVIFAAPSNNGGSALTKYTATANPGGITATTTAIATPAAGLSARVDINGLTAGTPYTFTVTASNTNGIGPASVASNTVTPTAYAPYWVADGGSLTGENPLWGDYSYGGNIYYGTTPGTAPRNGFPSTSYAAPNPPTAGTNVIEFDTTGAPQGYGGGIQPFNKHSPNQAAGNGRFNLAPYTYLTVAIWPTVPGQDILSYFENSIWFNGVATAGGNFSLTDATQNWPVNQFANWEFNDNTSGNAGTGIASSTATVITLSGGNGSLNSAGDYYEVQQPDHSAGQSVNSILPYGPNPMVVGQWNTYNIPLTAYNSATNGNVSGSLVLKFGLQSQGVPGPDTFYISNLGFTGSAASATPTVTLTANPTTITSGSSSNLTWSTTNATSCTASGGWTGAKATSGIATVSPTSTTAYTLTCTGTSGSGSASVTVNVGGGGGSATPTVSLAASPASITAGSNSTLTWSSTNATACTASGGWNGSEATSGTQIVSPTATTSYTLTCTGTGGTANATATVTVNTSNPPPVPSAPSNVTAFATTTGVYVLFAPPANAQSLALTQYTATTNTGHSASVGPVRIQNDANTMNYMQLNARIDINGLPSGTPVTVTVTATNSSGTSPASAPSNQVTPMAYAPVYVADGGGYTAESASWGDYSYSGFPIYGVQPGHASSNGTGNYPAPSNPVNAADNVVEFDNPNSNGGFQPYFHHQDPNNNQNGRLNLSPFTDLVISVWPTANQSSFQQALNVGVLKCLWVNGAVTSSGSMTLTDTTQNWPANIFVGALITDITNGNTVNVASNTADTLTFTKTMPMSPGDFYEISVPDIGIGQEVIVGNGTATSYGPTNLVSGQWNTYTIPLTAFNGGSTNYPNVAADQILKFNVVLSSNSTEVHYFSNVEFK